MIEIKAKKLIETQIINKPEVKNMLYLCSGGYDTNFYHSVKRCPFTKIIKKDNTNNLSLEPYDGFIISFSIFNESEDVVELVDKIISLGKPVIIVYNSKFIINYCGFKYLSDKFKIKFKELDCSIIENMYDDYSIGNVHNAGSAVSMTSSKGEGKAFIKNTKNCYIMRFDNVSIVHDVKEILVGPKGETVGQIPTTYLNLLRITKKTERPKWVNNIKILDDETIKNDIEQLEEEINKLKLQKSEKEVLLSKNEEYKKVLYSSGDELVDVVEKILIDMLAIPIDDLDRKKQDLYFQLDGVNILTEIKGVNDPFQRENISQTKRHVVDYANEMGIYGEDINKLCKGLLIINPYRKQELKDKIEKEFYSKEVIKDAKYENVCTLDTYTLLNYYSKWKNNNKSVDLKNIILKNTYNEPDYKGIIDL